jgi:hypothetical protein
VARLVDAEASASGHADVRQPPPGEVHDLGAFDAALLHAGDEGADALAEEVELVQVVSIGRMDGNLGRRQTEDQPAASGIDVR